MNEHLKVEINEKLNFKKVTCTENHYITNWDKKDIKDFTSAKVMYCPIEYSLDSFYCISDAEYEELNAKLEQALEDERNNTLTTL